MCGALSFSGGVGPGSKYSSIVDDVTSGVLLSASVGTSVLLKVVPTPAATTSLSTRVRRKRATATTINNVTTVKQDKTNLMGICHPFDSPVSDALSCEKMSLLDNSEPIEVASSLRSGDDIGVYRRSTGVTRSKVTRCGTRGSAYTEAAGGFGRVGSVGAKAADEPGNVAAVTKTGSLLIVGSEGLAGAPTAGRTESREAKAVMMPSQECRVLSRHTGPRVKIGQG